MKKIIFALLAAAAICACGNKKSEQPAEKAVNPMWGMWVQQEPQWDAKWEIMFNEDSTGFVFVDDKFYSRTSWLQDSLLRVKFEFADGKTGEQSFSVKLVADTLWLRDAAQAANPEVLRYLRFRQ